MRPGSAFVDFGSNRRCIRCPSIVSYSLHDPSPSTKRHDIFPAHLQRLLPRTLVLRLQSTNMPNGIAFAPPFCDYVLMWRSQSSLPFVTFHRPLQTCPMMFERHLISTRMPRLQCDPDQSTALECAPLLQINSPLFRVVPIVGDKPIQYVMFQSRKRNE